jgi:hypothetical protein
MPKVGSRAHEVFSLDDLMAPAILGEEEIVPIRQLLGAKLGSHDRGIVPEPDPVSGRERADSHDDAVTTRRNVATNSRDVVVQCRDTVTTPASWVTK